MPRVQKAWTRAEEGRVAAARRAGRTYREIGTAFGRTALSVRDKLIELGVRVLVRRPRGEVPRLVREYHRRGRSDTDLADMIGAKTGRAVCNRYVSRVRRSLGLPCGLTAAERARVGGNYRWAYARAAGKGG
jgi:hypothetical protein